VLTKLRPNRALIESVRDDLYAVDDAEKTGPMQAYMKSEMPFLGVQRPVLTRSLSPVFSQHILTDVHSGRRPFEPCISKPCIVKRDTQRWR